MDIYSVPSAAVAVIKMNSSAPNGVEEFHRIFDADGASANVTKKRSEEWLFRIASISKSVTAIAVMMLVDENKIDLDKPMNLYLDKELQVFIIIISMLFFINVLFKV